MARADAVRPSTCHQLQVGDRIVDYRLMHSKAARKIRVRVGPSGVDVVQPATRNGEELYEFLAGIGGWIVDQLDRADRLRRLRRRAQRQVGEILFRGEPVRVRVELSSSRAVCNRVRMRDGEIVVSGGPHSRTLVARSLELWLRKEARSDIEKYLRGVTARLGTRPQRVYVMDQRTKWGNCSAQKNLSFNWRLILAPNYVLRYLVTHEAVHLAVPDHSAKFWLMVQSLCKETERAKQWLCRHEAQLQVDLRSISGEFEGPPRAN